MYTKKDTALELRPQENPNSQNLSKVYSPARPAGTGKLRGFQPTNVGHFRGSGGSLEVGRVAGGAAGKLRTTEREAPVGSSVEDRQGERVNTAFVRTGGKISVGELAVAGEDRMG